MIGYSITQHYVREAELRREREANEAREEQRRVDIIKVRWALAQSRETWTADAIAAFDRLHPAET